MKLRLSIAAAMLAASISPAFAFQCPSDVAKIDAALAAQTDLSDEDRAKAQELRDEGESLHNAGQHQDSVDTLAQAKAILGIE